MYSESRCHLGVGAPWWTLVGLRASDLRKKPTQGTLVQRALWGCEAQGTLVQGALWGCEAQGQAT